MKYFIVFFLVFGLMSGEGKVTFYAYAEDVEDSFNKDCILCTESSDYAATIAFTDNWKLTYWINQAYLGRSLIISKRHFGTYEEMSDEEAEEYRDILRIYLPALKEALGATHFNVAYLMNQAYREEEPNPHFHWHIIPRYRHEVDFAGHVFSDPDFGNSFDFNRKQYLTGDFQKQAIDAIRSHLDIVYISRQETQTNW